MIRVVDSSVAIKWFLAEEAHPQADRVLEAVIDQPETFAVPELFAFEVYSLLLRLHPEGLKAFREGLIPLLQSGIFRQPMTEKLAVQAARYVRLGLTGYDACYAALAADVQGVWLTFDQKAHQAIRKEKMSVYLGEGTLF